MQEGNKGGFLRGDNSEIVAKAIGIPTMLFLIFSFWTEHITGKRILV